MTSDVVEDVAIFHSLDICDIPSRMRPLVISNVNVDLVFVPVGMQFHRMQYDRSAARGETDMYRYNVFTRSMQPNSECKMQVPDNRDQS